MQHNASGRRCARTHPRRPEEPTLRNQRPKAAVVVHIAVPEADIIVCLKQLSTELTCEALRMPLQACNRDALGPLDQRLAAAVTGAGRQGEAVDVVEPAIFAERVAKRHEAPAPMAYEAFPVPEGAVAKLEPGLPWHEAQAAFLTRRPNRSRKIISIVVLIVRHENKPRLCSVVLTLLNGVSPPETPSTPSLCLRTAFMQGDG